MQASLAMLDEMAFYLGFQNLLESLLVHCQNKSAKNDLLLLLMLEDFLLRLTIVQAQAYCVVHFWENLEEFLGSLVRLFHWADYIRHDLSLIHI